MINEVNDLILDHMSGAYKRAERCSTRPDRYFTLFVRYDYGDDVIGYEEVDVVAIDDTDARVIGEVALARDYEPGGVIVRVVERTRGWVFYDG